MINRLQVSRTIINNDDFWKYFDIISEPSNRATAIAQPTVIGEIQHIKYRTGTTSMKFLDQSCRFFSLGVVFKKSSSFLKVFNEKLAKMEPNGLMEYWRRFQSYSTTKIEEIGPQVLKMDHLRLGFLACCIPMALGFVVLIGELAWSRLVIFSRKNSNDSKKTKPNCNAEILSSEFRRLQPQERNVGPGELIEMHGIAVAESRQEFRVDWEDLIEDLTNEFDSVAKFNKFDKSQKVPHKK